MENKNLTITVSGCTMSGKSRMIYLLKQFLREQGFDVEQELNEDHPTEENFDDVMGNNFNVVIETIKTTRKIKIKEFTTPYI
jgi:uridine kinase